jgi:hypothetical protein
VVLAVVGCFLAAAAYAATAPGGGDDVGRGATRPLQPRLLETPPRTSDERSAEFSFAQPQRPPARARPGRPLQYECRLDEGGWEKCESPSVVRGLGLGRHGFEVRATNSAGRSGPPAGRVWRVIKRARAEAPEPVPVEPAPPSAPVVAPVTPVPPEEPDEPTPPDGKSLEIEVDTSALQPLFPGEPAQPLPVTVINPNSEPVLVTALTFSADSGTPECDATTNFELTPAAVSGQLPLEVPAESSASLSAGGAIAPPQIAMRELPLNQDACQGATLQLDFEAEAHG